MTRSLGRGSTQFEQRVIRTSLRTVPSPLDCDEGNSSAAARLGLFLEEIEIEGPSAKRDQRKRSRNHVIESERDLCVTGTWSTVWRGTSELK